MPQNSRHLLSKPYSNKMVLSSYEMDIEISLNNDVLFNNTYAKLSIYNVLTLCIPTTSVSHLFSN